MRIDQRGASTAHCVRDDISDPGAPFSTTLLFSTRTMYANRLALPYQYCQCPVARTKMARATLVVAWATMQVKRSLRRIHRRHMSSP